MTAQQTCAERIADYMASRAEDIGTLQALANGEAQTFDLDAEDAEQQLNEMPLSVELVRHVKILLGTGGPADWLDAELDADNDIRVLEYHYADWGDHAQVYVERDTPLWRFAESFVEVAAYADMPDMMEMNR